MSSSAQTHFNSIIDFMAPRTPRQALLKYSLLIVIAFPLIWLGNKSGIPISVGAMFGYVWGSLTTYGLCRSGKTGEAA